MVNSQVSNETVNALKIDRQVEKIPQPLPVVEVGVKIVKNGFCLYSSSALSGTVNISTAALKADIYDVYLTGITFSFIKDAACDSATGAFTITVTPAYSETSTVIASIPIITLTAQSETQTIIFSHPLKLARSGPITLSGTFTAGVCVRSLSAQGFYDETP